MEKEITIENQVEEIAIIAQFIEELGMSLHLPSGITMSLNLAIEEAIQAWQEAVSKRTAWKPVREGASEVLPVSYTTSPSPRDRG